MKTLVFTCGDINGIGPEIVIKTINKFYNPSKRKIIFICPANIFEQASSYSHPQFPFSLSKKESEKTKSSEKVHVFDLGDVKQSLGKATFFSGKTSADAIEKSYEIVSLNNDSAIITAPISKSAFDLAGINYPGQTEFYSDLSRSQSHLMTFLSKQLICGLVTIHEPISGVSKLLTKKRVEDSINEMIKVLRTDLDIKNPKLAVLGLNPHSGENGRIGNEEIDIIIPAIKEFDKEVVKGPFVPDAFFGSKMFKNFDAVLGMYHDQVLIPFKLMNFEKGVNYSAGLNIIRTSPDHGTAYDIAGKGIANPSSMIAAVIWAEKILSNRPKKNAG
jgi:4-hydroxythreonine-4-phosphate dehydrogenase